MLKMFRLNAILAISSEDHFSIHSPNYLRVRAEMRQNAKP